MERWRLYLALAGLVGVIDTAFLLGLIAGYAKKLGAGDVEAGFIAGVYSMVAIPASIVAGVVVDRLGRRRSLNLGLAWDTVSMILYTLASTPLQLAVVRGLHALGGSLVYPAYMAIVGDTSPRERLGRSTGGYLMVVAIAVALGSLSSAALVYRLGYKPALMLVSLMVFTGFLASLRIPETGSRSTGILKAVAGSLINVASAAILMFLLYLGFGAIVGGLTQALLNTGLASREETASALTGAAIGVATLASIPAFPLVGLVIDRRGVAPPVVAGSIVAMLGQLALASRPGHAELFIAYTLYGLAIAAIMTASTYLAAMTPREGRGTSMAIQQVANIVGIALGAPLGGLAAAHMGLAGVSYLVASSLAIVVVYTLILLRYTRPPG